MRIAVDLGNSRTKVALFDENSFRRIGAFPSDRFGTPRAAEETLREALAAASAEGLEDSVAAAVVPESTEALREALAAFHPGREPLLVDHATPSGLRLGYERTEELGPDRIADAVAGRDRAGGAVVVVDLGTATTFNAVDREGVFLGGAIAPGVRTGAEGLARRGARLFETELLCPERAIGRSTEEAIRSGVLWGAVAMVDGMAARILEEMGGGSAVGTGGWAPLVCPRTSLVREWDVDLTLKGLRLLSLRNR